MVCDISPAAAAGTQPAARTDAADDEPDSDPPLRRHAKALRRILFCVPARITRSGRRTILHLSEGFAHLELFAATYDAALTPRGP